MKIIILFLLSIPLCECFQVLYINTLKIGNLYYCIDPKIQDNEEGNNYQCHTQISTNIVLNTNSNQRILTYKYKFKGSGNDERYTTNTLIDEINYHKQMEKLVKFNYQMNLLKKLESNQHTEQCKLEAINEYNFLFEKHKYLSNIESGGLYHSWDNNDF